MLTAAEFGRYFSGELNSSAKYKPCHGFHVFGRQQQSLQAKTTKKHWRLLKTPEFSSLRSYGHFLLNRGKFTEANNHLQIGYDTFVKFKGKLNRDFVNIANDLGVSYSEVRNSPYFHRFNVLCRLCSKRQGFFRKFFFQDF